MSLISQLHFFFAVIILSLSLFLIFSRNPVHSVLFLIIIFFSSASVLILFSVDFIGLLFIIIYVGAIAVLFLFVVMMLDMKTQSLSFDELLRKSLFALFFSLFFFYSIYDSKYLKLFSHDFLLSSAFDESLDYFNNIDIFGLYLYNFFIPSFLIAGIILLVAMIGSISLTLKYRSFRKNELVSKQLARTNTFLSFYS